MAARSSGDDAERPGVRQPVVGLRSRSLSSRRRRGPRLYGAQAVDRNVLLLDGGGDDGRCSDRQVVATHEAGHAVVVRVLGQRVVLVRPRFTTYRVPLWTMRGRYRAAIVTLAGPAAEDQLCLYTPEQRAELWETAWRVQCHWPRSPGGADQG